jgi:hypothetical protein
MHTLDNGREKMPGISGDINYTINTHNGDATFVAKTPEGEKYLGGPERTVSNPDVSNFIADARSKGLVVRSFF